MNNLRSMSPIKGGVAWNPTKKANLVAWWRGDSNTQAAGLVTSAVDLSGNSQTVSFGALHQPTYSATALNGQPGWVGLASRLVFGSGTASNLFVNLAEFSMVIVFKAARESSGDFTQLLTLKAGASTNFALYTVNTIAGYQDMNFGLTGVNQVGVASYSYTAANYLSIDYNGGAPATPGSWRAWRNGVSQTMTTSSASGANSSTVIGAATSSTAQSIDLAGAYYDIFIYQGAGSLFTAADLAGIAQYNSARYGL